MRQTHHKIQNVKKLEVRVRYTEIHTYHRISNRAVGITCVTPVCWDRINKSDVDDSNGCANGMCRGVLFSCILALFVHFH
jgi:hypothetical protein